MKSLSAIVIFAAILTFGCSSSKFGRHDFQESFISSYSADPQFLADSRKAAKILASPNHRDHWPQQKLIYNQSVGKFIEEAHLVSKKSRISFNDAVARLGAEVVISDPDFPKAYSYKTILLSRKIQVWDFEERFLVPGVGIPVVGVVKAGTVLKTQPLLKDTGTAHNLTATLKFPLRGKPILELTPREKHETTSFGTAQHILAGDFTASSAFAWKHTKVDNQRWLGLFHPEETLDTSGVYFLEPYRKDKTIVLFTHGLNSSPKTFSALTNRLRAHPEIRDNFQFWFFSYPTGNPWAKSASKCREKMNLMHSLLDPQNTDPAFKNVVFIGHSMGGLISRYNLSTNSTHLLDFLVKDKSRAFKNLPSDMKNQAQELFVFPPSPYTTRVIFMATPHRGSLVANTWIGQIGQKLIHLPGTVLDHAVRFVTLSNDMILLQPKEFLKSLTSINQLAPQNAFIRGLNTLPMKSGLHVHSIIGNRGSRKATRLTSDGVVPYWSSHLPFAESEKLVPSGHGVTSKEETFDETLRILRLHLRSIKGISPTTPLPNQDNHALIAQPQFPAKKADTSVRVPFSSR